MIDTTIPPDQLDIRLLATAGAALFAAGAAFIKLLGQ
jgi:hypothetical protein